MTMQDDKRIHHLPKFLSSLLGKKVHISRLARGRGGRQLLLTEALHASRTQSVSETVRADRGRAPLHLIHRLLWNNPAPQRWAIPERSTLMWSTSEPATPLNRWPKQFLFRPAGYIHLWLRRASVPLPWQETIECGLLSSEQDLQGILEGWPGHCKPFSPELTAPGEAELSQAAPEGLISGRGRQAVQRDPETLANSAVTQETFWSRFRAVLAEIERNGSHSFWSENPFKLLKVIEDPKNFCLWQFCLWTLTVLEIKAEKLKKKAH